MRKIPLVLTAAASLALVAGAAQAQQSWGPKHTTYWNSDATGKFDPGQFMTPATPAAQPPATEVEMQTPAPRQRMNYQPAGKRVPAQTRVRQQQPANQGKPPAERGEQPPADAKPSAPPSQGQPPMQNQQPGQAPK